MAAGQRWGHDDSPFEEVEIDQVNPFSDLNKKERELLAKEAELDRREQELKTREEALARAGVFIEPKNWPSFFPVIHVDISNDIPVHLQQVQVGHMPLLKYYMCYCYFDYRGWKESAFRYGWFFLFYFFHISFCIYAAISPSIIFVGRSLTGFFQAINVMGFNGTVGILYFLGFAMFVLEALLSVWVMQKVYWYFRGKGREAEMRPDAAASGSRF